MGDSQIFQIFSALPIRVLFQSYQFKPSHTLSMVASETVYGCRAETLTARSQSYLTNSTGLSEQIRFPLRDRIERMLNILAADFKSQFGVPRVRFLSINLDDFLSQHFFKTLGVIIDPTDGVDLTIPSGILSLEEKKVIHELSQSQPPLSFLINFAQSRIYSCDYQTALNVLDLIPSGHERADIHHLKGLCHNFFSDTVAAEKEFQLMMRFGNVEVKANAGYVLSMLYLRLHTKERQDLSIAETYLQEAHQILMQEKWNEEIHFLRIFNRNGYALCLYRRGLVAEAANLLEWGITELKKIGNKGYDLHQSVLLYNVLQCYRTLGAYTQCEAVACELLALDPLFPEYHLEYGKTLLEQQKTVKARHSIQHAIVLDSQIPEAHALLAYSYVLDGNYRLAEQGYRIALSLKPDSEQFQNDLAYCTQEMETAS